MTVYRCASLKTLQDIKLDCEPALIREIWKAPDYAALFSVYPEAEKIERGYYRRPSFRWLKRESINRAGGFHGVEYLGENKRNGAAYFYCNAGDAYAPTILFCGRVLSVGCWGDIVERNQVRAVQWTRKRQKRPIAWLARFS